MLKMKMKLKKNIKSLINYSSQWQQEIKEIIDDVIYEVKENARKDNKIK